ncbi:MAG: 2Fe-2S iron-sulfur cluster-binding protein [Myxococcota bacterium]
MSDELSVEIEGHGTLSVRRGTILLEACEEAGIPMEAACGGFACCNTCRVEVVGDATGLSPMLPEEEPFLDSRAQRLACQAEVHGPVSLKLAPGA